jgi:hypothetical protein
VRPISEETPSKSHQSIFCSFEQTYQTENTNRAVLLVDWSERIGVSDPIHNDGADFDQPENQPTRTAGKAEAVPSVSEPPREKRKRTNSSSGRKKASDSRTRER